MKTNQTICLALIFCAVILPANSAYAYLDAGTGSVILQVLLAGIAGLVVVLKIYWRNGKEWIQKKLGRGSKANSD